MKTTNFKDVSHLYVGCRVLRPNGDIIDNFQGIQGGRAFYLKKGEIVSLPFKGDMPILRKLKDLSFRELEQITWGERADKLTKIVLKKRKNGITYGIKNSKDKLYNATHKSYRKMVNTPARVFRALGLGVDLFNLINTGQAVCGEKIKESLREENTENIVEDKQNLCNHTLIMRILKKDAKEYEEKTLRSDVNYMTAMAELIDKNVNENR